MDQRIDDCMNGWGGEVNRWTECLRFDGDIEERCDGLMDGQLNILVDGWLDE